MTVQKVLLHSKTQNFASCPKCGLSRFIEPGEAQEFGNPIPISCLACGFAFEVIVERRAHFRKSTRLYGSFSRRHEDHFEGEMVVMDLSRGGLQFEPITIGFMVAGASRIEVGDELMVEFHIEGEPKLPIRGRVAVRNVSGKRIGAEFVSLDEVARRRLWFYLMP